MSSDTQHDRTDPDRPDEDRPDDRDDDRPAGRREETEHQQLVRNVNELLQELRVAQTGVQILFAFLLTVAFTPVFDRASGFVKGLHLVTVLLAGGSVALLTAPAAWHRMLFQRRRRPDVVRIGNRFALAGLATLAMAMTCTVLLVAEVVVGGPLAFVLAGTSAVTFAALWFGWPALRR